jgi:hypothetical protein
MRAQIGDVGGVMAGVPCIECQSRSKVLTAHLGVIVATLEVVCVKRFKQSHPASVQRADERERRLNGHTAAVGQVGPCSLVVGLDGGPFFGERELESDIGVGMAVRNVMHHLAHGPTALAIGCVKLFA